MNIHGKTKGTPLQAAIERLATGEGEIDAEGADWKCPICGVGKAAFKPAEA